MTKQISPFPPKTDFFTKHGAGLLADHITRYWAARGASHVRADRYLIEGGNWGVESNLVDGLPPPKVRKAGTGQHSHGKVKLTPRTNSAAGVA